VTSRTQPSGSFCSAVYVNSPGRDSKECNVTGEVNSTGVLLDVVHPAYYVFIMAQLLSGIGSSGLHSLSFAYIDENAPRAKSSLYIGNLLETLTLSVAP